MGRLIYLLNVSLDGFVETVDHDLGWTRIDEEVHGWFNEQERALDAVLYGRRLYEVMDPYWPNAASDPNVTGVEREYAKIWSAHPKIVFSTTLESVGSNSRLVSGDVGEELAKLKAEFPGDLGVAGPTLAAQFISRGLVDQYGLVVHPVVLGAGTPFFPAVEDRISLELVETRTFGSRVVYLRYMVRRDASPER
jgi:dihydrofolate reductase